MRAASSFCKTLAGQMDLSMWYDLRREMRQTEKTPTMVIISPRTASFTLLPIFTRADILL